MRIDEYPPFTIIMRGYTFDQANSILQAMSGLEKYFAIEVTMNTKNALEIIEKLNENYGDKAKIGAGTVMNLADVKAVINNGAQFMLGPQEFSAEMLDYAHQKHVLTVPAGMTATEVTRLFDNGADIVKIFPAITVGPEFFKAIQAPLGKLRLMAVGGISVSNAQGFMSHGADYLGIGSSMFRSTDIQSLNTAGLRASMEEFVKLVE